MQPRLNAQQMEFWDKNGFLILRKCLKPNDCQRILNIVDAQWESAADNDHVIDILSGEDSHKHFRLCDAPVRARREVYKLNNLFARIEDVRRISYVDPLKVAISSILKGEPLICNSLNFERGSQQPYHIDTWYMPPPVDGMMVAASIALEDVDAANGPITLYPGSHHIPPWRFSHGRLNLVDAEAGEMSQHLYAQIEERGLRAEDVIMSRGDVLLWHAQLVHGGQPIRDLTRTRNSLVVHYWRAGDVPATSIRRDDNGAYLGYTLRGEINF